MPAKRPGTGNVAQRAEIVGEREQGHQRVGRAQRARDTALARQIHDLAPGRRRPLDQVGPPRLDLRCRVDGQRPLPTRPTRNSATTARRSPPRAPPSRARCLRHRAAPDSAVGDRLADMRMIDHQQVVVAGQIVQRMRLEPLQGATLPDNVDAGLCTPQARARDQRIVAARVIPGHPFERQCGSRHNPNSARILAECSPMRGAATVVFARWPFTRIGDRVVRTWTLSSRSTVCSRSSALKPSLASSSGQFSTLAHQMSAGSRIDSQCSVVSVARIIGEDLLDLVALGEPARRIVVIGVERLQLEQIAKPRDRGHGDGEVGVLRPVDAIRRGQIGVRAVHPRAYRQPAAVVEVGGENLELEIDERLEQAGLDVAALAGDAPAHERRQDRLDERRTGEHVADRQPERHRPLPFVAVQPHDAGTRLRQQVLTRTHRPRPLVAEAGDAAENDGRIDRRHDVVAEAEPLDDAGAEILDEHVGLADEVLERLKVGRVLEVEGDALLAAVDGVEQGRVAADLGIGEIEAAAQVAALRAARP